MTIIQPNKDKLFLSKALVVFCAPLLAGIVWLVILYNQTVNISHNIQKVTVQLEKLQTENAEFQDSLFGLFDSAHVELFAEENKLIKEKNPHYLETNGQWAFASQ